MSSKKERLYIAYGSNLNLQQMKQRCPTAEVVGTSVLRNWKLWFRGANGGAVATVEREIGCEVPVLIWRIQPQNEQALDRYEGWPHLYRKETLRVSVNGRRVRAMIYIMNEAGHPYGTPSMSYLCTIIEGYQTAGFDSTALVEAVYNSKEANK